MAVFTMAYNVSNVEACELVSQRGIFQTRLSLDLRQLCSRHVLKYAAFLNADVITMEFGCLQSRS